MQVTYAQAVSWIGMLWSYCLVSTAVAFVLTIASFFLGRNKKRIARLAILGIGVLELFCCGLYVATFIRVQGDGMGLLFLAVVVSPMLLLMLVSGIALVYRLLSDSAARRKRPGESESSAQ